MSIPLIVLTNGRQDCIAPTLASIGKHLTGYGDTVIVDDSGDPAYRAWLAEAFQGAYVTAVAPQPAGYWRAMRAVWNIARGARVGRSRRRRDGRGDGCGVGSRRRRRERHG